MRPASAATFSDPPESLLRRRTAALALVVGAHVLLVFMLLRLAPPPTPPAPPVTTFELIPDPQARTETVAKPKRERRQPAPPAPAQPLPPPPIDLPYKIDGLITITREDYAAADIAKLPSHRREAAGDEAATASVETAATGPNGERLYNAEWYRRPTDAELSYYLPAGVPRPSWAMIACQTVDDYRVDNCVELGQSTPGVALAAAIREAAWQFRVWPPRIGGRPLVGAWVRIRIDFTEVPAK